MNRRARYREQKGDTTTWNGAHQLRRQKTPCHSVSSLSGNGDFAANARVDADGTLRLLLSKGDSWSSDGRLLKLGAIKIRLMASSAWRPGPSFKQTMHVGNATISVADSDAGVHIEMWIDASSNVLHVMVSCSTAEASGAEGCEVLAEVELWRTQNRPYRDGEQAAAHGSTCPQHMRGVRSDSVVDPHEDVVWYHRNSNDSIIPDLLKHEGLSRGGTRRAPAAQEGQAFEALLNRTFGCLVKGHSTCQGNGRWDRFTRVAPLELRSQRCTRHELAIFAHTSTRASPHGWLRELEAATDEQYKRMQAGAARWEGARSHHLSSWQNFWRRSWMNFLDARDEEGDGSGGSGGEEGEAVSRVEAGFAMERLLAALSGRRHPIKFNGNLFTTENEVFDADFRQWGGMYWFQNTRWPYTSMAVSGDLDLMHPFFDMYLSSLPLHLKRTSEWYGHAGAVFPETQFFWGSMGDGDYGCDRPGKPVWQIENAYIRNYVTGSLELVSLALETFAFSQNHSFAQHTLLPLADAVLTFFDEHFARDVNGLLVLAPSQALETYQSAINPAPDVAGLTWVLQELLLLPDYLFSSTLQGADGSVPEDGGGRGPWEGETAAARKERWRALLDVVPDLPVASAPEESCRGSNGAGGSLRSSDPWAPIDERLVLAPAEAWSPAPRNYENPALYAVYPFRLFQVGKEPRVPLPMSAAVSAFNLRPFPCNAGWCSDAVQAAHLGAAQVAAALVEQRFSSPTLRFPGFYLMHFDYTPEVCTGAVAKTALQAMAIQHDGDDILLFPAWPARWSIEFKLHAPHGTVVEAECRAGTLKRLRVTPEHRRSQILFPGSTCLPPPGSSL